MSNSEVQRQIEQIFQQAVELSPQHRGAFLDEKCSDNYVRVEVEKLLKYAQVAGGGLTDPIDDPRHLATADMVRSALAVVGVPPTSSSLSSSGTIDHGQFLPGTVLCNRFRVVGMLGQGGMGEVYRADDLELGQSVALKFLPKRLAEDTRALARFRSEVRLARQVSHANVCRVHDIGQIDDQWFLSMEYIDGEDLAQLLRRIGRFPAERATELARQLCLGLHAAHEKGVLHRDLKPANIMIDGRGKLVITDFGLAELGDQIRDEDIRSGTPAYMSPEQLAGREVTERSDIYSLGIILHEIFTGRPVWEANSMAELLNKRKSSPAVTTSSHVSELDPLVAKVIERCLEPDPKQRPSSPLVVTASLPGGDPLQAALAAGELPSPDIVAASGEQSVFKPVVAVSLMVGIILCLSLVTWLAEWNFVVNRVETLKEPAVLAETANHIVQDNLGYDYKPDDAAYDFLPGVFRNQTQLRFWYRQRPSVSLDHFSFFNERESPAFARPTFQVPSWYVPNELGLILSSAGKLIFFRAVPPVSPSEQGPIAFDESTAWSTWFPPDATGYVLSMNSENTDDPSAEQSDAAPVLNLVPGLERTPPDACDVVRVWRGYDQGMGQDVFIVAAAYRGKPSYFEVMAEDEFEKSVTSRAGMLIPTANQLNPSAAAVRTVVNVMLIATALLAWFNIWSGRGDRKGSFRVAVTVFCMFALASVAIAHKFSISKAIFPLIAQSLLYAMVTWIFYIALEPLTRKFWPRLLIGWTRLIEGRWRDELVGKSILIGMLAGTITLVNLYVVGRVLWWWDPNLIRLHPHTPSMLHGPAEILGVILLAPVLSVFFAFMLLYELVTFRVLLRKEKFALVATCLLTLLLGVLRAELPVDRFSSWYLVVVTVAVLLYVLVRFGFLANAVMIATVGLVNAAPLTFDSDRWYYTHGMFVLILLSGIAGVACYTSMGGRSALAGLKP